MPQVRFHKDWSILNCLSPVKEKHILIDLGARNGWFFKCWSDVCPQAEIHAFEPDIVAFESLQTKHQYNEKIHISNQGVGAKSAVETFYHFSDSQVSSSFLKPDQKAWSGIHYETGELKESEVSIISLDDYCSSNGIQSVYIIKIDIQGYELQALQGAINILKDTSYLLVESAIKPLYVGAATFTEVHDFLSNRGFDLIDFRAWHRGNNVLIETDMLFRRKDLAPEIAMDGEHDRTYI